MAAGIKEFNFVYQNIRSMRRNMDRMVAYIESGDVTPLIIGLSEIWIYANEIEDFNLDGYNLFANCNGDSRAGGVAIYASNSLNCKQLNLDFQTFDAVGITFPLGSKLLCVVCIYRLHNMSISDFVDEFSMCISELSHTNLFIMGDFNIDFLHNNMHLDNLLVNFSNNGLDTLVSEPTRFTDHSATCIDNVLYRYDQRHFQLISCSVLDVKITDHCLLEIKLSGGMSYGKIERFLEIHKVNYNSLKEILLLEEWGNVYGCLDASVAFDSFMKVFKKHVENCTTLNSIGRRSVKLKPWMSDYLLNLIRKRNKICQLAKRHPNNLRLKSYSLKLCNIVNEKINSTKNFYYKRRFDYNGKNARKNWQTINEIIAGHPTSDAIKEIIDQNGCSISDSVAIANDFNVYFTRVGDSNSPAYMAPVEKEKLITEHYDISDSFLFSHISSGELYQIINSLKSKSSPGVDRISNVVVKKMACYLVDILAYIFNLSVATGIFPVSLKKAVVVPIFKKGDRTSLSNYRPISLLSVFSKIFEKAMKNRITSFLDKNNFLSSRQFGFRKNKNTEQAVLSLLEQVSANIDVGLKTSALFLDLTKAFDRVVHSTLLMKLYRCGFRGSIHTWFCSYLKGRTQIVRANNSCGKVLPINVGVPQGSVLGPLLFLIYANGIFQQNFSGSLTAFADDFSFVYASSITHQNNLSIERDLDVLSKWLSAHNLHLSDKTKIMHFRDQQSTLLQLSYHVFGCNRSRPCDSNECFSIQLVNEFRYLGILIDAKLNWKAHVEALKSRLLLVSRKLYNLRLYCPKQLLRMVYFALADSILQYGLSCWGGACKTTLKPLLIRQKHLVRIICFKEMQTPSWPIFQELDILPLRHMFVFKVLRIFFIISGNNYVNYAEYSLRSNFQFKKKIPNFKLDLRRSFFNVFSPIIYNNLPLEIRMCSRLSVFSNLLRHWLTETKDIEQLFHLL